ncbi:DUF805 domain-containing protein [Methylobacterium sp. Leaf93]|uniref:DUF805 domain-containing protein n=1 Tax=Methylobacterium sp. Leaf93 TaxID=1736249 RepID=UPI00070077C8|nr:DUF805 domain-containing protein [Methylobacterium sp. Leaf93]KQP09219.1 hypothetical protein ASF26_04045 [Methylobacterium sp. Leaf93]
MMDTLAPLAGFFDPRGRLSRRHYHRRLIGMLLLFVLSGSVAILAASLDARFTGLAIVGVTAVGTAAVLVAATIRRLHDRQRTGWWMLPDIVVTLAGFAPTETFAEAYPLPVIAATLAMTGFNLWFFVETICRRGTPGPNRYGPEPER